MGIGKKTIVIPNDKVITITIEHIKNRPLQAGKNEGYQIVPYNLTSKAFVSPNGQAITLTIEHTICAFLSSKIFRLRHKKR